MQSYVPKVYQGQLTLFKARDNSSNGFQDHERGWMALAVAGVNTHELPGDHYVIMREPNVSSLAQRLTGCISRIECQSVHPLVEDGANQDHAKDSGSKCKNQSSI